MEEYSNLSVFSQDITILFVVFRGLCMVSCYEITRYEIEQMLINDIRAYKFIYS